MIQMLVDHPALRSYDMSSLKEHHLWRLADQRSGARPRHGGACPHVAVHPGLRHDRTVADRDACCTGRSTSATAAPRAATARAGRATLGCEVRIVDADDKPVPTGTVGEIIVRGDNVMMGYWERPEETAQAVIDGWMHTGDGGYMDEDGFVYRRRPRQGHDHLRRRERLFGRGRERHRPASGRGAMRRDRHSRRAMGRAGPCRRGAEARRAGRRRRADRVLQER